MFYRHFVLPALIVSATSSIVFGVLTYWLFGGIAALFTAVFAVWLYRLSIRELSCEHLEKMGLADNEPD